MMDARPVRVAVVAPIMVRHDAISLAARDSVRMLAGDARFDVCHYGSICDFPEIPHRPCHDASQLLLEAGYQAADVAIFHFGIHHPLFDALLGGGPRARAVRFHNVTPAHLVAVEERPLIAKSLDQLELLRGADEIWPDSQTNADDLLRRGFAPSAMRVMPLVVEDPAPRRLEHKPAGPVTFLFVGRIAPAKGVHELIAAFARARLAPDAARLVIAGNARWSDPAYLRTIRAMAEDDALAGSVRFASDIDDAERERLYHVAHALVIPSYHEGFCRPVAEGLRAGCIPIVYDAYNLPRIAAGLGRVVPAGDVAALADALGAFARCIPEAIARPLEALLPLDRGDASAAAFSDIAAAETAAYSFQAIRQRTLAAVLDLADPDAARRDTGLATEG
jgi:glycosyltransferase involved in cell wall biosynthesis